MSKKIFNPADWTTPNTQTIKTKTFEKPSFPLPERDQGYYSDVETITQRIESLAVDIAPTYADWRDLGFALANELGGSGKSYYHRLSKFYQNYNPMEADKQFEACLKAHGNGVSIKTFYHLAKAAGINVGIPKVKETSPSPLGEGFRVRSENAETEETSENETNTKLCSLPFEIFDQLPDLLRRITDKGTSPEDRDILLLGSLVSMSACLPNVYGIYAEREVFANLFLFVTAQASAGKGRLTLCRKLVDPIHKVLREQNKAEIEAYKYDLAEYYSEKGDKGNLENLRNHLLKCLSFLLTTAQPACFKSSTTTTERD